MLSDVNQPAFLLSRASYMQISFTDFSLAAKNVYPNLVLRSETKEQVKCAVFTKKIGIVLDCVFCFHHIY